MHIKKVLSVIALVMLSACGSAEPGSSDAEPSSADGRSVSGDADAAEGGKSIVYWSMWDSAEPQGVVLADACKAYEEVTGNIVQAEFKGRTGIRDGLQPAPDAEPL